MKTRLAAAFAAFAVAAQGCAAARVVGPEIVAPPVVRPPPVVVVLEPFFEAAPLESQPRAERYTTWTGMGAPADVTLYREVQQKPLFAQVPSLELEHRIVLDEVRRLRPEWQVYSTSALSTLEGPVRLVRVVVGPNQVVGSNRALLSTATAFGIVLWPLLLVNINPVEEVEQVQGTLTVYDARAQDLRQKRVRYPTQPDFAVDTRGLEARVQPFAVQVAYEEGLFADKEKRAPVLLRGFAERLAASVVALVEGLR